MLEKIISFSIKNKLIVILFTLTIAGFGLFSLYHIPVGSVPDITNNQVQIITTSTNLSTQEIEQFITTPVEMEVANLPGVIEIRSISKFGISMVTVVFTDKMGTYLPRQLIAEKIKSAAENIPEEYGTPEMGPISTGLGEIYQYILDVKPGYENQYTPMELRTIQDWIVKRRLSGVNGVVEVNSWGGYLKQYEIAINPDLLRSHSISLLDVFHVLENNNNISGGAYIEKNMQSYFIRGDGQVKSLNDIENIVVKNTDGIPVYVKDIAKVQFGHANRFGAITANGKGETILGQVMMLKDANSKEVIKAVKERVSEIQKNLPEGVFINPVLERSELITKTSHTVAENLILGALIVFLIVLLFLGNIRSAIVIASMIPLALLFTISMMYVFGIDANLMSLGALDFGIIIDGAVIIVEYIVLRMGSMSKEIKEKNKDERHLLIDEIAGEGASKMMKSAIFGQVIILIVFIPILSLQGVEGKMFHPMALAFSFAIIGAMLLGLTWLPVASSLFLKPVDEKKKNLSTWLIEKIYKSYFPVISWSCTHKRIVLGVALLSLLITVFLFTKIGGEFVPTLDEGDFVIQPALKTGTSLTETIKTTTRMENILLDEFPDEVDQIVCRIGAAEVPTDPMSMEEIDMIIKLHPKDTWQKANTKEQLAMAFKEALSVIPGIEYEFTQPIEMRFNELITGVRSDIAIKVYGDNLDYVNNKAAEIKRLINDIPGAGDVILEKTTGLPQIKIVYKRKQLALYHLDVKTLNTYVSAAFGGQTAGVVFEGEKRFDMVMRLQNKNRTDIEDIQHLLVAIPTGEQIPLSEFADITYTHGPAKISRDNTHRRVVVSVNVRDRDLQSVVHDIEQVISANVKLLPGNYIEYGGQFENLQNASKRLLIAVPIALLLIFIFLHFAFQSLKDAVMIFTAIPLATVGGVFALWIRQMPFSVSAGIGFIALFGIAVLNGIVLIEHLKELQKEGSHSIREIILKGTKARFRPVLLTAGAAAMGFLPMAISTGAGAEVQRPLATVVIGGLVTSTMLTLIALPLLFEIFYNIIGVRFFPLRFIRAKSVNILILLLAVPAISGFGQSEAIGLPELYTKAEANNRQLKASALLIEQRKALSKTALAIPKTNISYGSDQNNIAENGYPLTVWSIQQEFAFPTLYTAQKNDKKLDISISEIEYELERNKIFRDIAITYYKFQQLNKQIRLYENLNNIYNTLLSNTKKRFEVNDANKLEVLSMQSKCNEISLLLKNYKSELAITRKHIQHLINDDNAFIIDTSGIYVFQQVTNTDTLLYQDYIALQTTKANNAIKLEKSAALPDFSFNYFIGSNTYNEAKNYHGFEIGIAIPLFFSSYSNAVKSAKMASESQQQLALYQKENLQHEILRLLAEKEKYSAIIKQYKTTEHPLANELKRAALKAYQLNEINFLQFTASIETAIHIEAAYYENIFNYNKTCSEIYFFTK